MNLKSICITLLSVFSLALATNAQVEPLQKDVKMKWWRDARFGMFIHWGAYSELGGFYKGRNGWRLAEHIMLRAEIPVQAYELVAREFNPHKFDAQLWVEIAKSAGMKYIVITAKHHDGFCMYESDFTKYDIVDWGDFGRDPIQELADACRDNGIGFGVYYSHLDWHYTDQEEGYDAYRLNQVGELAQKYQPDILWFDDYKVEGNAEILNLLRTKHPQLITNERVTKRRSSDGDYLTAEQRIPKNKIFRDWEACITMNNSWGYHSDDFNWKSDEILLHKLIDVASKGGNFLLNVGPDGEGVIPQASVERLQAMGDWMRVNGEAIYGATASSLSQPVWGRYTEQPGKLYAHVFEWPESGALSIPMGIRQSSKVYLLGDPDRESLPFEIEDQNMIIRLPETAPDAIASVLVVE